MECCYPLFLFLVAVAFKLDSCILVARANLPRATPRAESNLACSRRLLVTNQVGATSKFYKAFRIAKRIYNFKMNVLRNIFKLSPATIHKVRKRSKCTKVTGKSQFTLQPGTSCSKPV